MIAPGVTEHGSAVQAALNALQRLSHEVLFLTVPGTQRRKRLGKKALGIT